jgi:drug/metabolite transporter (DMT)-like permease
VSITAIWGFTFPVVKTALDDASAMMFTTMRMGCAALLLAVLYRKELRRLSAPVWRAGAVTGLLMASGYALQTIGLAHTTASKSAFLTGLSVIFVPFLVALLLRRMPPHSSWSGALLALCGLYLLAFFPVGAHGASLWQAPNRGDLLTLACALCFAGHIVAIGHYSPRMAFQSLTVLMVAFSAVFTVATTAVLAVTHVEPAVFHSSLRLWGAIGLTAVLATAVAFSVQAWAQRFTPSTHTAIIFALEPVFGLGAAVWWRHERVTPIQLAGCALILVAILLIEFMAAWGRGRHQTEVVPHSG